VADAKKRNDFLIPVRIAGCLDRCPQEACRRNKAFIQKTAEISGMVFFRFPRIKAECWSKET